MMPTDPRDGAVYLEREWLRPDAVIEESGYVRPAAALEAALRIERDLFGQGCPDDHAAMVAARAAVDRLL